MRPWHDAMASAAWALVLSCQVSAEPAAIRVPLDLGPEDASAVIMSKPGGSDFEDFGTVMKYALPAAAAICAGRDDRLGDLALRGLTQAAIVLVLKSVTDGTALGQRPATAGRNGGGRGFPSGHTAAAGFGAADLAGKCWRDDPAAGLAAYGAVGLTAASRVAAGQHNIAQVAAGAAIGLGFGGASFGLSGGSVSFDLGLRF
ncbi:MAG: phosphatase PAP2 family protein [Paracoccus sp. (in: a-proteobacteria)]|nr:phosphatase PAP2 family protein [Paracoccus sp. (in: a-proteobacteria)]